MEIFPSISRQEAHTEKEPQIPELSIHETSPHLENQQAQILKEQWERFWQLRSTKQKQVASVEQNASLLKDGDLLHNLRYDEAALAQILKSGIISGELGYGEKEMRAEDAETHYCADFFVNQGDKTVSEFVEYAYGNEEKMGMIRKKRIESYACPREQNDSIAVVVGSHQPELTELLQHSATGFDTSQLDKFPLRFPYNSDKPEIAKRHLAVLVGIPANYISKLVIGGKLASNPERLAKLKELVGASGLNILILTYKGEEA